MSITSDRVKGMLIGGALGDALGVPHEFHYQQYVIYTGTLVHRARIIQPYQQPKYLSIGQVSDATVMTITLIRSLLRNSGYNRNNVILSYMAWSQHMPLQGKNTRSLFRGIKTLRGYEKRMKKLFPRPWKIGPNQMER